MLGNSSICDDQVFAQLTDMFGDSVPMEIILRTGQENKWKRKLNLFSALNVIKAPKLFPDLCKWRKLQFSMEFHSEKNIKIPHFKVNKRQCLHK